MRSSLQEAARSSMKRECNSAMRHAQANPGCGAHASAKLRLVPLIVTRGLGRKKAWRSNGDITNSASQ